MENGSYFDGMLPDCNIAQVTPLTDDTDHPATSERPEVSGGSVDGVGQHPSSGESDPNGVQTGTQVFCVAAQTAPANRTRVHDGSTWSSQLLVPDRVALSCSGLDGKLVTCCTERKDLVTDGGETVCDSGREVLDGAPPEHFKKCSTGHFLNISNVCFLRKVF